VKITAKIASFVWINVEKAIQKLLVYICIILRFGIHGKPLFSTQAIQALSLGRQDDYEDHGQYQKPKNRMKVDWAQGRKVSLVSNRSTKN
jgi:hypothetical protein